MYSHSPVWGKVAAGEPVVDPRNFAGHVADVRVETLPLRRDCSVAVHHVPGQQPGDAHRRPVLDPWGAQLHRHFGVDAQRFEQRQVVEPAAAAGLRPA
jgi:hypothetical protein